MSKASITVIILTFNEQIHLQRCIDSVKDICQNIVVVDSFSTDNTQQIAVKNNVQFVQNIWTNYATQFNWALENANISTDWVLRLDADEYLTEALQKEIQNKLLSIQTPINGIVLPLKRVFLGRHIKRGTGVIKLLRLFRTGLAKSESRWMDEHIALSKGQTIDFSEAFADDNLNNLSWWTQKHVGYAIREAIDLLDIELDLIPTNKTEGSLSKQASNKRALKKSYSKKPLFLRAFIYFIYRYIFRLGFLEGKEGFLWHFLQGWWYRTLVDAKIYEIKKACGSDPIKIKNYLKEQYSISL
ncbi:glycosyltransferase family 2 protein [Lacinutrix sp. MEBiC02404]